MHNVQRLRPVVFNDVWPACLVPLWQAGATPTTGEIRDQLPMLEAYRDWLLLHTIPASADQVGKHLLRLNVHYGTRDMSEGAWEMLFSDYIDLLRVYPDDIWKMGIDAALLEYKFLPKISELNELMKDLLESRAIRLRAAKRLIAKCATK